MICPSKEKEMEIRIEGINMQITSLSDDVADINTKYIIPHFKKIV